MRIFEIRGSKYLETEQTWLDQVGIGLTLWEGEFEGIKDFWLRWCDGGGNILLTGDERAKEAENRATEAENRATEAENRARRLAEQLRALGVEPEQ